MNNVSTKLLVGTVVVTALLTAVFPAPVAAEPGTVSVNAPDSASPGDEVTVSFEVTNTGEEPNSYILDLSLPEGYTITDRVDNDGQWKSGASKWLWQTIETGDVNTKDVEIDIETPEDASSSDTISAELTSQTGIEETASISIIESTSDEKNIITGNIANADQKSIENSGDTEVTISRIDGNGSSSSILVDSIPFSDFDTLASANSDVNSASFSENGNDPASYTITLLRDGSSQYQIKADRAEYQSFSAITEPLDAGETTAQNIRLIPSGEFAYQLGVTVDSDQKSTETPIGEPVSVEVSATQRELQTDDSVPAAGIDIDLKTLGSNIGNLEDTTVTTDSQGEATTTFTSDGLNAGETNISASFDTGSEIFTTEGSEQAEVEVFQDAQIAGDVVGLSTNNNVPGAEVTLNEENATGTFVEIAATTTGPAGSFSFTGEDGVRSGENYLVEASFTDEEGNEGTGFNQITEIPGGTTNADIVIEGINVPEGFEIEAGSFEAPASAAPGDEIEISAGVTNTAGGEATSPVTFVFDDSDVTSQDVTLGAGATDSVSFTVTVPDVADGEYVHGIETGTDSESATITVESGGDTTVGDVEGVPSKYATDNDDDGEVEVPPGKALDALEDYQNDELTPAETLKVLNAYSSSN